MDQVIPVLKEQLVTFADIGKLTNSTLLKLSLNITYLGLTILVFTRTSNLPKDVTWMIILSLFPIFMFFNKLPHYFTNDRLNSVLYRFCEIIFSCLILFKVLDLWCSFFFKVNDSSFPFTLITIYPYFFLNSIKLTLWSNSRCKI